MKNYKTNNEKKIVKKTMQKIKIKNNNLSYKNTS
jgi:hypothetical protein